MELLRKNCETQTEGFLSLWLQEQRINAALPYLSKGKVLDFGCGNGQLARYIDPSLYIGIDINPAAVRISQKRFPSHTFLISNGEGLETNQFGNIAALAVLEHLSEPSLYLKKFHDVLKPQGMLVITTPNPAFRNFHEWGARLGVFSMKAAEEHDVCVSPGILLKLAQESCFEILESRKFLGGANQLFVFEN